MPARTDAYLERIARRTWAWAAVWESTDGRFLLQRTPGGMVEVLSENVATPDHPRRAFLLARVRLGVLAREAKAKIRDAM